jgi:hypothetical protein
MDLGLSLLLVGLVVLICAFVFVWYHYLGSLAVIIVVGGGALYRCSYISEKFLGVWSREILCKRGRLYLIDRQECRRILKQEMVQILSSDELATVQRYLPDSDWKVCIARNNELAHRAKALIDSENAFAEYIRQHPEITARYEPPKDNTFVVL